MIAPQHISILLPVLLAACGSADRPNASASADASLIATGLAADDVAAARSYLAPFTTSDQQPCFGDAALGGAAMAGPATSSDGPALTRVAIAVDGSGSMAGRVGSRTKLDLARDATQQFIAGLPTGVPAALSVFGQQGDNGDAGKAKSCAGIDLLAPMSTNRARLTAAVANIRAVGWTPLAAGLKAAQAQLTASSIPGEQVVYVVSDGIETCGGDPVAVARDINRGSTRAVVNIIGFGLPAGEAAALQAVAGAGGGRFVNVIDDGAYVRAMAGFREQMRRIENRVAARVADAGNSINTGAAITDATICTGKIVTDETLAVGNDLNAREQRGEAGPPRAVVFAVLKQRHDAMAARRDAYAARLKGARDTANDAVAAQEKSAR